MLSTETLRAIRKEFHRVHPTEIPDAGAGVYAQWEVEFMNSLDAYKRANRRPAPEWCEVLAVLRALGYVKRPAWMAHEAARLSGAGLVLPVAELREMYADFRVLHPAGALYRHRDYTRREVELVVNMAGYSAVNRRPFPRWSEALAILLALGWRRPARWAVQTSVLPGAE